MHIRFVSDFVLYVSVPFLNLHEVVLVKRQPLLHTSIASLRNKTDDTVSFKFEYIGCEKIALQLTYIFSVF